MNKLFVRSIRVPPGSGSQSLLQSIFDGARFFYLCFCGVRIVVCEISKLYVLGRPLSPDGYISRSRCIFPSCVGWLVVN